jgi:CRP-like cAMP-binding protein
MGTHPLTQDQLDAERENNNRTLIDALSPHVMHKMLEPGEVIFVEATWPDGIYILERGSADLLFSGRGEHTPHRIDAGTILGLSSLVSDRAHEYTATSVERSMIGYVSRSTFFKVLQDDPARWFDVLRILSRDIGSCYDRVRELSQRRAAR